ncbi:MAG: ACT domain-containing protein [Trueperaceae bacterium]|nr:ACT domain-containing protein [Trueperaceae bacterium]
MTYTLRIALDDRPGSLARIAAALGDVGANIVELDVLERSVDLAVDQLVVQAPGRTGQEVRDAIDGVDGATVEVLRPTRRHAGLPPLGLAVRLARADGGDLLRTLADGTVVTFEGTWAAIVRDRSPQTEVLAASAGAPSFLDVPTPWLPLRDVRRIPSGSWTPPDWLRADEPLALAAAPLRSADEALVVCRPYGPRFAQRELGDLAMLADLAVAELARAEADAALV